jgi:hypothetical protein
MDTRRNLRKMAKVLMVGGLTAVGLTACMHMAHMIMPHAAERPSSEAFGFGPRASNAGLYQATLDPVQPIKVRRMQTMRVVISDSEGRPVEGATITVDGGMPEHRHGLPTQPRVTRGLGGGAYEVEGVKFNMGGWWELKFAIAGQPGTDSVTFNLDL